VAIAMSEPKVRAIPAGGEFVQVAEVRRGDAPESWHFGAVAVVSPEGESITGCGDAAVETFVRSAAKPFQILPLLEAGGLERYQLSLEDIALICASHSGNPEHVARSTALLERAGFDLSGLRCGGHPPMNPAAAEQLRLAGECPTALHNNCSGKHAGQLMACRLLDLDPAEYEAPEHPLQLRILGEVERFFDLDRSAIGRGIDGCSLPTFCVPLDRLARAYARLADPRRSGLEEEESKRVDHIYKAMTEAPDMVAGAERFTSRLMTVTGGRVLGKEGAEGVYAMAVRGPRPLGIALKIADGGERARDAVVVEVLAALGCLTETDLEEFAPYRSVVLRNWCGIEVGEIVATVRLEDASATPGD